MQATYLAIIQQLAEAIRQPLTLLAAQPIAGGDINTAVKLDTSGASYFVKLNQPALMPMFAAEYEGLQAIAATNSIAVPTPILYGQTNDAAFLVLPYIAFGRASRQSERLLGQQLAQLHQQPQPYFGWPQDNTIGTSPQSNSRQADWVTFWREQRLGYQLALAAKNGYGGKLQQLGERLAADFPIFFKNYQPAASLLHGDLWGGNAAVNQSGQPLVFDPACYFGDRETDLAMTTLFGGFSPDFYAAYNDTWPLDTGFNTRKTLYNLYHVLNHLNLFGGGYGRQAEQLMMQLLAEIH